MDAFALAPPNHVISDDMQGICAGALLSEIYKFPTVSLDRLIDCSTQLPHTTLFSGKVPDLAMQQYSNS